MKFVVNWCDLQPYTICRHANAGTNVVKLKILQQPRNYLSHSKDTSISIAFRYKSCVDLMIICLSGKAK